MDNSDYIVEKFNQIQNEILDMSLKGIMDKYHPDVNLEHPEAFKLFQLYKEILDNMRKRLVISSEIIDDITRK
jgi:hypothetical protein